MWAILQVAGAGLKKFGAEHPIIKRGIIALVAIVGLERAGERGDRL